jgi:hypothetical protein
MADRCSFCGSIAAPFSNVEGLFTVLKGADCQAARGRGSGPCPVMTAEIELVSRDDPRVGDRVPLYACGDPTINVRMLLQESD